jgi:hypothetical protein
VKKEGTREVGMISRRRRILAKRRKLDAEDRSGGIECEQEKRCRDQ